MYGIRVDYHKIRFPKVLKGDDLDYLIDLVKLEIGQLSRVFTKGDILDDQFDTWNRILKVLSVWKQKTDRHVRGKS